MRIIKKDEGTDCKNMPHAWLKLIEYFQSNSAKKNQKQNQNQNQNQNQKQNPNTKTKTIKKTKLPKKEK